MTTTDPAGPWAPEAEAAPGRVFRTELNPADFLSRAAYMYPDKTAVVDGDRRYSYRQFADRSWRLANALRSAALDRRKLTGTSTPPAAGTPKWASSMGAELSSSVATRSPLPSPAERSAFASRHERSANWR